MIPKSGHRFPACAKPRHNPGRADRCFGGRRQSGEDQAQTEGVTRRAGSFIRTPRPFRFSMLITDHFSTLAPGYDTVLSDVWGVIHNGVSAFPAASEALSKFRQKGGAVVLISNAPRPGNQVIRMLDRMGVPHAAYDGIVTLGDV